MPASKPFQTSNLSEHLKSSQYVVALRGNGQVSCCGLLQALLQELLLANANHDFSRWTWFVLRPWIIGNQAKHGQALLALLLAMLQAPGAVQLSSPQSETLAGKIRSPEP